MDTVLKKGSITKKAKKIILGIAMVDFIIGVIFLIINDSCYNAKSNKLHNYLYHYYSDHIRSFWQFPYVYIGLFFGVVAICLLFALLMMKKVQITITDRRVCGKTCFGRSVDLPIDSISAVGSSLFNGIAVSTSSGKVSFLFIEDSKGIRELLCQLLIDRQEKQQSVTLAASTPDELKKYKELLDGGIITQEEFDAKKKQLLNL